MNIKSIAESLEDELVSKVVTILELIIFQINASKGSSNVIMKKEDLERAVKSNH